MAELVQNRSQRLHFDVSSPNGILLFRVTSEMIVAYGKRCCVLCLFTFTKPLGACSLFWPANRISLAAKFHLCIFVAQLAIAARKTECLGPISLDLNQPANTNFQAKPDVWYSFFFFFFFFKTSSIRDGLLPRCYCQS